MTNRSTAGSEHRCRGAKVLRRQAVHHSGGDRAGAGLSHPALPVSSRPDVGSAVRCSVAYVEGVGRGGDVRAIRGVRAGGRGGASASRGGEGAGGGAGRVPRQGRRRGRWCAWRGARGRRWRRGAGWRGRARRSGCARGEGGGRVGGRGLGCPLGSWVGAGIGPGARGRRRPDLGSWSAARVRRRRAGASGSAGCWRGLPWCWSRRRWWSASAASRMSRRGAGWPRRRPSPARARSRSRSTAPSPCGCRRWCGARRVRPGVGGGAGGSGSSRPTRSRRCGCGSVLRVPV